MNKKLSQLILAALILFSVSACSAEKPAENKPSDNLQIELPLQEETNDKIDLEGYDCVIFYRPDGSFDSQSIFWYNPGTKYYELAEQRLSDLRSELNCNIKVDYYSSASALVGALSAEAATGNHGADIVAMSEYESMTDIIFADYILPLDDVGDIIDYHNTEIYGPANIMEPALANGKQYMLTPYTHPERQLLVDSFLVFGDDLVNAYSLPDLRAVHEQKQWTWDYFEKFLRDYTVIEDGKTVIYGLAVTNYFPALVLSGNGYRLAVTDGNGGWRNGCLEQNVLEAIDWVKKIKTEYKDCVKFTSDWDVSIDDVINGRAFICASEMDDLMSIVQYKLDNFGILPIPYGPSCEYGKESVDAAIYGYGIAVTSDEPDSAAYILDGYCQPFEEYPTIEDALKNYEQLFFDKRDIETLRELTYYSRYLYWGGDGISYLNSAINKNYQKNSAVEIAQNIAGTMNDAIEKFIVPNMEYVDKYFTK